MSGLSDVEKIQELIQDPGLYDDFKEDYKNTYIYYRSLRNEAPGILSFDEYLELHRVFLENKKGNIVRSRVEEYLPRSIKNMVLGDSPRGKAYPAHTLKKIEEKINKYNDIGVDTPSLRNCFDTIFEHMYDNGAHWKHRYAILNKLLIEKPNNRDSTVEAVARARLVSRLDRSEKPREILQNQIENYIETINSPSLDFSDENDRLVKKAKDLSYSDPRKPRFYLVSVCRDPSLDSEFLEYLYLTSRKILENYRHGDPPSRGSIILANLQLKVLDNFKDKLETDIDWMESYKHLTKAILNSGSRWSSSKENLPSIDFGTAAKSYIKASNEIKGDNQVRYERHLKYLSKAFRHKSLDFKSLQSKRNINESAINFFLQKAKDQQQGNGELIQELIRYHTFRKQEANLEIEYKKRNYDNVLELYDELKDFEKSIYQEKTDVSKIEKYKEISRARKAEKNKDFGKAQGIYSGLDKDQEIENRIVLCQIKEKILEDNLDLALDSIDRIFEEKNTITVAIHALKKEPVTKNYKNKDIHEQFVCMDEEVLEVLDSLIDLYKIDTSNDIFLGEIEEKLLKL